MRKQFCMILFRFVVLFGILAPNLVHAKEQIDVYVQNFPPFHILEGDYKNTGVLDYIAQQVSSDLKSDFNFNFREANFARFFKDARNGRAVCSFAIRKTKARAEFMDFSIPFALSLGNGLVVGPHIRELINGFQNENGEVNLREIHKSINLTYWSETARSYEAAIEEIVKDKTLIDSGVVQTYSSREALAGVLKNLTRSAKNAHFAYAEEVSYHSAVSGIEKGLSYFRVMDESEDYSMAHLACSKGDWNDKFIVAANKIFRDMRTSETLKQAHMRWLPENIHQQYSQMVDQAFDNLNDEH
ncbi:transporter substrate-binding domain-containing protein [Curvivirga aplysinae]|uniref:transporter substrate-binding domain-containing protein n=1 Tax=Curvivirga aplysinae TaxID=2529852 RepID=UPI0012BC2CE0|nr:transporter substrate-binding domain-containing protein [Curvivirga aplysinae]MTI10977.1 transporter substrate-binding domain-containing protein [Curvivirga aplysinae]